MSRLRMGARNLTTIKRGTGHAAEGVLLRDTVEDAQGATKE